MGNKLKLNPDKTEVPLIGSVSDSSLNIGVALCLGIQDSQLDILLNPTLYLLCSLRSSTVIPKKSPVQETIRSRLV